MSLKGKRRSGRWGGWWVDHSSELQPTVFFCSGNKAVKRQSYIENNRCSPYFSIASRPIEQFPLSTVVVLMVIVVSLSIFTTFLLEISLEKIDFLTVSNVDSLDFGVSVTF